MVIQSHDTAQCTDPCHSAFIVANGPSLDGIIKCYSLHTVILKVAFRCGHAKSHVGTADWPMLFCVHCGQWRTAAHWGPCPSPILPAVAPLPPPLYLAAQAHTIQNINTVLYTPFLANFQSSFATHAHTHTSHTHRANQHCFTYTLFLQLPVTFCCKCMCLTPTHT